MIKNIGIIIKSMVPKWEEYGIVFPTKLLFYSTNKNQDKYDNAIRVFLDKKYGKFASNFFNSWNATKNPAEKVIWSLWWQGEQNLPEVVQRSRKSLEEKCGDYKVVLLSKSNINEYVTIPEKLFKLVDEKKISLAALSDYIRIALLKQYGGIWLDATIFLTGVVPAWYLEHEFLSRHLKASDIKTVANGRWSGYYMVAGAKNSLLFCFLVELYNQLYSDYNIPFTYLILDYFIDMAYRWSPEVKRIIDSIPYNNEDMKFLQNNMNNEYNEKVWKEACANTIFQKLSWKLRIEDNPNSFYHKVCK